MTPATDMGSNITNNDNEFLRYNDLYMTKGDYGVSGIRINSVPDINATFKFLNIELLQEDLQQSAIDVEAHISNFKNNIFRVQTTFNNSFSFHKVPQMVVAKLTKAVKTTKQILSALDLWSVKYNDSLVNAFVAIDNYNKIKNDLVVLKYKIDDRSADISDLEPLKFYKLKESYARTFKRVRTKLMSAENEIRKYLFDIVNHTNAFNRGVIPLGANSSESININLINDASKMIYGETIPWETLQLAISKTKDSGAVEISYDPGSVPDTAKTMQSVMDKYTNASNRDKRKQDEPVAKKVRKSTLDDVNPNLNLIGDILKSKNQINQQLETLHNIAMDTNELLPHDSRFQFQDLNKLDVAGDARVLSNNTNVTFDETINHHKHTENEDSLVEMTESVPQDNNTVNRRPPQIPDDSIQTDGTAAEEQRVDESKITQLLMSNSGDYEIERQTLINAINTLETVSKSKTNEIETLRDNGRSVDGERVQYVLDLENQIQNMESKLSEKNSIINDYNDKLTSLHAQQHELNTSYKSNTDILFDNLQDLLQNKEKLLKQIEDEKHKSTTSQDRNQDNIINYEQTMEDLNSEIDRQKKIIEQYVNKPQGSANEQINSIVNDRDVKWEEYLRVSRDIVKFVGDFMDNITEQNNKLTTSEEDTSIRTRNHELSTALNALVNDMTSSKDLLIKSNEEFINALRNYSKHNVELPISDGVAKRNRNSVKNTQINTDHDVDAEADETIKSVKKIKNTNTNTKPQVVIEQDSILLGTLVNGVFVIDANSLLDFRFVDVADFHLLINLSINKSQLYEKIEFNMTFSFDTRGIDEMNGDGRNYVRPHVLLEEADKNITIAMEIARVLATYWIYNETTALFINTVIAKIALNLLDQEQITPYLQKIVENTEELVYNTYFNILNYSSNTTESAYIDLKTIVKNIPIQNDNVYKRFKTLLDTRRPRQ